MTMLANTLAMSVLPVSYKARTASVKRAASTSPCVKGFKGTLAFGEPKIFHIPMMNNGIPNPREHFIRRFVPI